MTPLEEAVARIIDPYAWRVEYGIAMDNSLDKARRILALPEIVKMQEALTCELSELEIKYATHQSNVGYLSNVGERNSLKCDLERGSLKLLEPRIARIRAALQSLKKEAE